MLKFSYLALGLLAVIAIVSRLQAATVNGTAVTNPVRKLHAEGFRRKLRHHRWAVRHDRRKIDHDRRETRLHY